MKTADPLQMTPSEKLIVGLVGAIQFINILEFMMIMPLGPDFAASLGISAHHLGLISGSYTAASAIAGILAANFLERFDRRLAIAIAMTGLIISTIAAGLATNLTMLLIARILAGCFGGPSTALALAIITDVVPAHRRGRAMGAVMSSFALASVIGVPAGLEIARLGGWRLPFFFIAGFGTITVALAIGKLPKLRGHLDQKHDNHPPSTILTMIQRKPVIYALLTSSLLMSSAFMIIPNIAPYVQYNLHYPRSELGLLYLVGGTASFFSMIIFGRLTDRFGSLSIGLLGAIIFSASLYFGFINYIPGMPIILVFATFMMSSSLRGVAFNTLSSKVPHSFERARFMSVQSSVQHLSSAIGAIFSSKVLAEASDQSLIGIDSLGWLSMVLNGLMILFLFILQKHVLAQKPVIIQITGQTNQAAS